MALEIDKTPDVRAVERTKKYKKIEEDLHQQRKNNGKVSEHFKDLVDDYMRLYVTKCLLDKDVKERGVYITYDNGGGQCGTRKNDSVEQFNKVNTQMLKILSELDLKPSATGGEDDDL